MRRLWIGLVCASLLPLACQKPVSDDETTSADESTVTTTVADTGDGDGGDGDGECNPEGSLPGSCTCVEPGTEPCFQACQPNTGMLTCDEVCGQIGETCVSNGCAGGETSAHGSTIFGCPSDNGVGWTSQACDQLIPIVDGGGDGDGDNESAAPVECCCTLSS